MARDFPNNGDTLSRVRFRLARSFWRFARFVGPLADASG